MKLEQQLRELRELVAALQRQVADQQDQISSLKTITQTQPAPAPQLSQNEVANTSRRRMLKKLAVGLVAGVGTATAAVAAPQAAQAKFVASKGAGAIVMPADGAVSNNLPATTVYGLIATPDPTLDLNSFSPNIKGGVLGYTNQPGSYGVFGFSTNSYGVYGVSTNSFGVYGVGTNSFGVYGYSPSNNGVLGSTGIGVDATPGNPIAGVNGYAITGGAYTAGVIGQGKTLGVWGISTNGTGVSGVSAALSGVSGVSTSGNGVFGSSSSYNGVLGNTYINGDATPGDPIAGVNGSAYSGGAYTAGVAGQGKNIGVWGKCTAANGVGVYGSQGIGAYAGRFDGTVFVTDSINVNGFIYGAAKPFKIDHPIDPANKYLYHTAIESPDMKTVYDGVVTLDEQGEALVKLPEWFEALNSDYRYQLTSLGHYSPVYIAREIAEGSFSIGGGQPGQKICWQVTGIRQDAWASANRTPVEEAKNEAERGYYLHPEVFGFGKDMSMDPQARTL
jgi:hypothetical protein